MDLYVQQAWGEDINEWRFPPDYRYTTTESLNQCAWFSTWLDAQEQGDQDTQKAAELVIT
ncbi:MAG: hypothetical protein M9950_03820 [Thermomicrobiales bacterium]|nr:hypothetical protein [Thermomicrobiales bacterium]